MIEVVVELNITEQLKISPAIVFPYTCSQARSLLGLGGCGCAEGEWGSRMRIDAEKREFAFIYLLYINSLESARGNWMEGWLGSKRRSDAKKQAPFFSLHVYPLAPCRQSDFLRALSGFQAMPRLNRKRSRWTRRPGEAYESQTCFFSQGWTSKGVSLSFGPRLGK